MPPQPIQWVGAARYELRDFPDDARLDAGFALWAVQKGEEPPDSKPMPIIGQGTRRTQKNSNSIVTSARQNDRMKSIRFNDERCA
jgi:phage-related protein